MTAIVTVQSVKLTFDDASLAINDLVAYWEARGGGRPMPTRRDLDAVDLRPWLGRVNLFERMRDGDLRVRLRGYRAGEFSGAFYRRRRLQAGEAPALRRADLPRSPGDLRDGTSRPSPPRTRSRRVSIRLRSPRPAPGGGQRPSCHDARVRRVRSSGVPRVLATLCRGRGRPRSRAGVSVLRNAGRTFGPGEMRCRTDRCVAASGRARSRHDYTAL